jgi:hypothetical protein
MPGEYGLLMRTPPPERKLGGMRRFLTAVLLLLPGLYALTAPARTDTGCFDHSTPKQSASLIPLLLATARAWSPPGHAPLG